MTLDEFLPGIPKPGWPGRRRAIARELLRVAWEGLFFVLFLISLLGIVLLVAAGMDVL